jgi:hypothetical protein
MTGSPHSPNVRVSLNIFQDERIFLIEGKDPTSACWREPKLSGYFHHRRDLLIEMRQVWRLHRKAIR